MFQAHILGSEYFSSVCFGVKPQRLLPSQTSYPALASRKARESSSLTQYAPEDCSKPWINRTGNFAGEDGGFLGGVKVSGPRWARSQAGKGVCSFGS